MTRGQLVVALGEIRHLSSDERAVLEMRFGYRYRDGELHTIQTVAQIMQMPPERVREVEAEALQKLVDAVAEVAV